MDTSRFLAKVIGIYSIVVGISFLININDFDNYIKEIVANAPLLIIAGFFTLILGILIVVSHNIWEWSWRVVITLIGWMTLLKGASLILYPEFMQQVFVVYAHDVSFDYFGAIAQLILGILLVYFGYRREHD